MWLCSCFHASAPSPNEAAAFNDDSSFIRRSGSEDGNVELVFGGEGSGKNDPRPRPMQKLGDGDVMRVLTLDVPQ